MSEDAAPTAIAEQPTTIACPKCGRGAARDELGCARCGLLVARFEDYDPAAGEPPVIEAAWARLVETWGDHGAHDRIQEIAIERGALPSLVRRYRARQLGEPNDPISAARLKRVIALVEHGAKAQAAEPVATELLRAVWYLGYLVGIIGVLLAALLMFRAFTRR